MKTLRKAGALTLVMLLAAGLAGCGGGTDNDRTMDEAAVTLGEYTGIPVTIGDPGVRDTDVDQYLQTLIYYRNMTAEADRTTIQDGDTVWSELYLYDEDGELLDDGAGHSGFIYIGSGQTYPELEEGLIGKETGQEYEISVTLPDPYEYDESLSGQTIMAKASPQYIQDPDGLSLDGLTDEQAGLLMDGVDSVEELKSAARASLEDENADIMRRQAYEGICAYLLENCSVDPFPGAELATRTEQNMEQSRQLCENYYGITFEEYLAELNMTEEAYREDIKSSLSDTIRLELIFTEIGDREGIQYDEAEFDAYIAEILEQYTYGSADELYAEYGEDYIRRAFRIEYVVDWLINEADLSYTVPDYTE